MPLQTLDPSPVWNGKLIDQADQVLLEFCLEARDPLPSGLESFDLQISELLLRLTVPEKADDGIAFFLDPPYPLPDFVAHEPLRFPFLAPPQAIPTHTRLPPAFLN